MSNDNNITEISKFMAVKAAVPDHATMFVYLFIDGIPLHIGIAFPIKNEVSNEEGLMVQIHENGPSLGPGAELIVLPTLHEDAWTVYLPASS